jgi:hypothetical protein
MTWVSVTIVSNLKPLISWQNASMKAKNMGYSTQSQAMSMAYSFIM